MRYTQAAALTLSLFVVQTAGAQPWTLFTSGATDCDVVNAASAELVVLEDTGELVIVTGPDVVLADTFVDFEGNVFFAGESVGFIVFDFDAEGLESLWWVSLVGSVVDVDPFTGEPTDTGLFPDEFANVPCDACPFWDNPDECEDDDFDGVVNIFDFCPLTPVNEIADFDGCSCSQLIGCDDDTEVIIIEDPVDVASFITVCGSLNFSMMLVMLVGLGTLRSRSYLRH